MFRAGTNLTTLEHFSSSADIKITKSQRKNQRTAYRYGSKLQYTELAKVCYSLGSRSNTNMKNIKRRKTTFSNDQLTSQNIFWHM